VIWQRRRVLVNEFSSPEWAGNSDRSLRPNLKKNLGLAQSLAWTAIRHDVA
jgi:hypothetical protein